MSEGKSPSFQFYPKDWFDFKVQRMSDKAQAAYIRLICHIWTGTKTQYSIEDNDKQLAKSLGVSLAKWRKIRAEFQDNIEPLLLEKDGLLISERLKIEKQKQVDHRLVKSEAGKKGAAKRWQSHNSANGKPMAKDSSSSSSSSPSSYDGVNKDNRELNDYYVKLPDDLKRVVLYYCKMKKIKIQNGAPLDFRITDNRYTILMARWNELQVYAAEKERKVGERPDPMKSFCAAICDATTGHLGKDKKPFWLNKDICTVFRDWERLEGFMQEARKYKLELGDIPELKGK